MLIFERLADAYAIDGVTAVEQNWKATDDVTGVYISKSYPITATEASIKADLITLFPPDPVVPKDRLEPLRVLREGNSYKIVDEDGKPIFSLKRDASGNAELQAVDTNGNTRRVLTPQVGTVKLDGTATIADVSFDQSYTGASDDHPVVTITPSKPLPDHELNVTRGGFSLDFATPPTGTIAWSVGSKKK